MTDAYKISDKVPKVKFFYVDIHDNFNLRLNEAINNKLVYPSETSKNFSTCSKNLNGILTALN